MADAQPDYSGSCMIALYPQPAVAGKLAVPDGLDADSMHVTIAYTGDAADVDRKALKKVAKSLAGRPPIKAVISGHARFTGGDKDVIVALVDSPELETLRADVRKALDAAGITIPSDHGFTAHCSIRYCDPGDDDPVGRLASFPVTFGAVSAVHGDKRTDYPFTDPLPAKAREAFASGWALSGGPLTETVKAGCEAAVALALENRHDPAVLEVTLKLGSLSGVWATVYQRREALTARIARDITAAWRDLVKKQDIRSLLADYRRELVTFESTGTDAKPTKKQKAAALAAALLWLRHVLSEPRFADLADAIITAMAEAVAEGRTAALAVAASKATAAGFDWAKAYAAMQAAVTQADTDGAAGAVTQAIMRGMAADLGKVLAQAEANGLSDEDTGDALSTAIDDGEGAELAVDTAVSGFIGMGSVALAAAEGILLDWLTAGDGRVCAACLDNEDNGPYEPSAFPPLPEHMRCRCCSAPADPMRFTAFADFLIPAT